jgi:bifunctional non-homologous end joining protein LigD
MPRQKPRRFVVQRHRATRLHYDFRLEMHGVLVSWAVPKGPTLDPSARRQAIAVEDHELDYIDFEGVIAEGHYGAGDVIVWDTGTWEPAETDSPEQALEDGTLHFDLNGKKLKGRFVMTRTSRGWLLLHKKDGFAVPGWDPEEHPDSVLSGRTNEQVSATGPA